MSHPMQTYTLVVHYKSGTVLSWPGLTDADVHRELAERMRDDHLAGGTVESWTVVPEEARS